MRHTIRTAVAIGVFLSLLWLPACSTPAPTNTPTLDLNPLRTEVAATVLAQVSRDLALTPSATPIPSHTPTSTYASIPTLEASASPGPLATLPSITLAAGFRDQAQWVSQSVADNSILTPGETFTMTWSIRNVGTSSWTASYLLRFYSGDTFGAPKETKLGRVVLPMGTIDISIPMKAPITPGFYRSDWVLSNESRSNFKEPVFLKITIAAPPTPTPTPTLTSTPTLTTTP